MNLMIFVGENGLNSDGARYSDKFKYRPAASPVVTERMKDGRLLVRGAFRNEL